MQDEHNPTLPKHVAIIMDGNGRWAQRRSLLRIAGHEEGVKAVKKVVKACVEKKIKVLTLFAFGIENWGRPIEEVKFLMKLFVKNLQGQVKNFMKNNIQLRIIGDDTRFEQKVRDKMQQVQAMTANNTGLILVVAFNYSGRWDLLQATKKLCEQVAVGNLTPTEISYPEIQKNLCLADLPEPDLFIRTSGEQRVSNFMLWQLAYTELYFTHVLWPDFDDAVFEEALQVYANRQRRYGLTSKQVEEKAQRKLASIF